MAGKVEGTGQKGYTTGGSRVHYMQTGAACQSHARRWLAKQPWAGKWQGERAGRPTGRLRRAQPLLKAKARAAAYLSGGAQLGGGGIYWHGEDAERDEDDNSVEEGRQEGRLEATVDSVAAARTEATRGASTACRRHPLTEPSREQRQGSSRARRDWADAICPRVYAGDYFTVVLMDHADCSNQPCGRH